MGVFDDLVPSRGGSFDDLIPQQTPYQKDTSQSSPLRTANPEHILSAVEQRTNPDPGLYRDRFLGPATIGETGEVFYKDAKGVPIPTDKSKHVVLDGKVYARSEDTNEGSLVGAARALVPGLATGPVQSARSIVPQALKELPAVPAGEELRQAYLTAKNAPEVAAVKIKPEAMVREAENLGPALNAEWLNETLAPKSFNVLSRLTQAPQDVNASVTMANVDAARRRLGAIAGGADNEERAAATIIKKRLDEMMTSLPETDVISGNPALAQEIMQAGRGNYRGFKLDEALNERFDRAGLEAAKANSGLNKQNRLRSNVEQFLKSSEADGLKETQRAVLEGFVKGTLPQNVMRWAGNALGGGGGLGAVISGGAGAMAAGPAGIALPAVGFGLNRLSAMMTSKQAQKIAEAFRADTPLAKQLRGPIEDWNKAVKAAQETGNARNLSRLLIASRNLSTNLKDADIRISPNELLKSLFGQKGAGAETDSNE